MAHRFNTNGLLEPSFTAFRRPDRKMNLSSKSTIVATRSQVSYELEGETIILHSENGTYFGLSHVGTFVWNQIRGPHTVREIRDAVISDFDVSSDECERDLLELLKQLWSFGLIEVRDETVS